MGSSWDCRTLFSCQSHYWSNQKRSAKEHLKKGGIAILASIVFFIITAIATPSEEVAQESDVDTEVVESQVIEESEETEEPVETEFNPDEYNPEITYEI